MVFSIHPVLDARTSSLINSSGSFPLFPQCVFAFFCLASFHRHHCRQSGLNNSFSISLLHQHHASFRHRPPNCSMERVGGTAHEKEKLHLTAAIHLERIREKNEQLQAAQDPSIANLLRAGVQSLQRKIQEVVEQVNEVLDEIRCYILDEE